MTTLWMIIASVGVACCVLGWVGAVFGPRSLVMWGVLGFLLGIIGQGTARRLAFREGTGEARLGLISKRITVSLLAVFGICVVATLALSFWSGSGVSDFPALEKRPKYELNSHGAKTEVSRFRYLIDGIVFTTGWHSLALAMNISAFHKRRYGYDPA